MSDIFTTTSISPSTTEPQQDEAMIVEALRLAAQATDKAKSVGIATKVKEAFIRNADDIQNIINKLAKVDAESSQKLYDELDEQMRLTKMRLMEEQSKNTAVKYATYIVVGLFAVGALIYFTKPKATPAPNPTA